MKYALLVLSLCVGSVAPLFAQITNTSIAGFVMDPSGAAVGDAVITATQPATGFSRSTHSGRDGGYTLPSLPLGTYTLTVEHQGFKTYERTNFGPLSVGRVERADIVLQIGATSEKVEVTAESDLIRLTTSETSYTVDKQLLQDLPLGGRNPLAALSVFPGVTQVNARTFTTDNRQEGASFLVVNGSRTNQTDFLYDASHFNGVYFNTGLQYPNPDALAEFKFITNTYSAEYGRNGGSIVQAITKSGTNQFHGSAFEYNRNSALATRGYAPKVPRDNQNIFGATAGLPILRNKLFFFAAYQGVRDSPESLLTGVLSPTQAERAGDFSSTATPVIDPQTGQPFQGNVIPTDRLNQVALNALQKVPLPDSNGLLTQLFAVPQHANQGIGRIDWNLNSQNMFNLRYYFDEGFLVHPIGDVPQFNRGAKDNKVHDINVHYTKNFGTNLLNDFIFGFTKQTTSELEYEHFTPIDLGVDPSFGQEGHPDPPFIQIPGWLTLGGPPGYVEGGKLYQFRDTFNWIRGRHHFKFGGEVLQNNYHNDSQFGAAGIFVFSGFASGNAMADFLLGTPQVLVRLSQFFADGRSYGYYYFVNDDFKVNRRLTLNLGFRHEINTPWDAIGKSGNNELATWVAGRTSRVYPNAPPGQLFPSIAGKPGDVPDGLYHTPLGRVQPRIGFAYDLTGSARTVVRGAYGIFGDPAVPDLMANAHINQPWFLIQVLNAPAGGLSNPYQGLPTPFPYTPPPPGSTSFQFSLPATIRATDVNFTDPQIHQWNFTVEHDFGHNFAATIAYVGAAGRHLNWTTDGNPAKFIPGTDPNTGQPLSTAGNIDSRRIHDPGLVGSVQLTTADATSSYNALQLSVNKRLSYGLVLVSSYTLQKAMSENDQISNAEFAEQNPFDKRAERARSDFDRHQRFALQAIYNLPTLSQYHPIMKYALGGWEIAGIANATTGQPLSVLTGFDRSLDGLGRDRPNQVGDPLDIDRSSKQAQIAHYWNKSAFALPPEGSYGNVGRNSLTGPGSWGIDMQFLKNFPIREQVKLQVRAELDDILNHVNLGNPVNTFSSPAFGRITSFSGSRRVQFGVELYW